VVTVRVVGCWKGDKDFLNSQAVERLALRRQSALVARETCPDLALELEEKRRRPVFDSAVDF
jgi:hypothetical protein